jgi:hypothetical protein
MDPMGKKDRYLWSWGANSQPLGPLLYEIKNYLFPQIYTMWLNETLQPAYFVSFHVCPIFILPPSIFVSYNNKKEKD